MFMHPKSTVFQCQASAIIPDFCVTIAVDTAYVASQQGRNINKGVYMIDNNVSGGSSNEGQMELSTVVPVGATLGFHSVPINALSGDTVIVTGFNVSQGSVFGSNGYPKKYPLAGVTSGNWWIGQAMNQGGQVYQVQLMVTVGKINPAVYYINWDPYITAQ